MVRDIPILFIENKWQFLWNHYLIKLSGDLHFYITYQDFSKITLATPFFWQGHDHIFAENIISRPFFDRFSNF